MLLGRRWKQRTLTDSSCVVRQVPELKKALEDRGLETKGLKAELVDRLKEALLKEAPADAAPEGEAAKDADDEEPAAEPAQEAAPEEPKAEEPKAEEPKAEEPKAEEPKAEEPTPGEAPAPAPAGAAHGCPICPAASTAEAAGGDAKVEEAAEVRAVEADAPPSSGGAEGDSGKRAREEEGGAEGADDASKRAKTEEAAENSEAKEGENGEAKEGGEAGDAAPPPYQPPAAEGQHAYAQGADAYAEHGQVCIFQSVNSLATRPCVVLDADDLIALTCLPSRIWTCCLLLDAFVDGALGVRSWRTAILFFLASCRIGTCAQLHCHHDAVYSHTTLGIGLSTFPSRSLTPAPKIEYCVLTCPRLIWQPSIWSLPSTVCPIRLRYGRCACG